MQDLLLTIARCSNVEHCLHHHPFGQPCAKIVAVQQKPLSEFQLPEPWSGDLGARLLFLGSNPGLAPTEEYPQWSWSDDEITDFFVHRFRVWVRDGLYPRVQNDSHRSTDSSYKRNWVRYWAATRKRAADLLGRRDPQPGVDYAFSEIVHCKSKGEKGVRSAMEECRKLYLQKLVAASGARVVVCQGLLAKQAVRQTWDFTGEPPLLDPMLIGRQERHFLILPHPNARTRRRVGDHLSTEDIQRLQQILGA